MENNDMDYIRDRKSNFSLKRRKLTEHDHFIRERLTRQMMIELNKLDEI